MTLRVIVEGKEVEAWIMTYKHPWSRNPFRLLRQFLRGRGTYEVVELDSPPPAGTRVVFISEVKSDEY